MWWVPELWLLLRSAIQSLYHPASKLTQSVSCFSCLPVWVCVGLLLIHAGQILPW
jgi:hypothetical protein